MSNLALKPEEKYTYADCKTWPEDERWEIIDGVAYNMGAAPMRVHQKISRNLLVKISVYLENKTCEVYDAPFDVRFVDNAEQKDFEIENVVQPDLVVVCDPKKLDDYGCKGSPDIIIEILSKNTTKIDKIKKFDLYEKYKVKEYWIVSPDTEMIEIYTINNGQYGRPQIFVKEDKIEVKLLGDLVIDLNDIFK